MNSNLYDRRAKLPEKLINHLKKCFSSVDANSNTEGFNRNKELTGSDHITYQQIKRIKNWFDSYGGNKEDAPFILNGGDRMKKWCDEVLRVWRGDDESSKKVKKDTGMENQYLHRHGKNTDNLSDTHVSTADKLKVEQSIKKINKLINYTSQNGNTI